MTLKEILKEFTREGTSIEHFNGCPSGTEMTLIGFSRPMVGADIPSYRITFSYFKDQEGDYCSLLSNQDEVGALVIHGQMDDSEYLHRHHAGWYPKFESLLEFYGTAYAKDLSSLSDKELLDWSAELTRWFKDEVGMPGFIDSFMFYADRRFSSLVREFCELNGIPDPEGVQVALSAPTESSFLNEEERELYALSRKLAAVGYDGKTPLDVFLSAHPEEKIDIDAHLAKYSWIKSSYVGHKPYVLEDFETEVRTALSASHDGKHDIFSENALAKQTLLAQYPFSEEILAIVALTELLVKWQDERKNYSLLHSALRHKVLDEVARRTAIEPELLRYALSGELPAVMGGELSEDELRTRQAGSLFMYVGGEPTQIVVGEEAAAFMKDLLSADVVGLTEVKGTVASKGKAQGPARVVFSIRDIEKVQPGEVLVTSMTRPEHVPAMRKAVAIVTDDGGITCHAAIVSRELKKPCVIGTKLATKVFKDGDIVEVDAEKGIVRKIDV